MTDPHPGWVDPNPPDPVNPRSPVILTVSGAVLTALVVATLISVVVFASGDDRDTTAGEVVLITANSPGGEPFFRSIVVAPVAISNQAATKISNLLAQIPIRTDRGVRLASGRQQGLYGTTGQVYPCDVVTLANALDADPATATTWGLALGITLQQIPYYLNTLTAVVLMADTWVTTHTPSDRGANPKQAVLQAGNAVLVDPLGVPRVQCASGAPLVPPVNDALTRYHLDGDQWPGFAPQTVVAIQYAMADAPGSATEFTLVDTETGQQVVRKTGGVIDLRGTSVPLPDPAVMNIPPDLPESGQR